MSEEISEYEMGVDEAGRGPLIGPMVIAGVVIEKSKRDLLIGAGVRDSKKLDESRREEILPEILRLSKAVIVRNIMPYEIDRENINDLEVRIVSSIIKTSCRVLNKCPEKIYVDAIGEISESVERIKRLSGVREIYMEVDAEEKHPVVAAASIVAKVLREWYVEKIKRVLGDFGSGYPSDPKTIKWLEENRELARRYRGVFIREKWSTYKRYVEEKSVKRLDEYFKRE